MDYQIRILLADILNLEVSELFLKKFYLSLEQKKEFRKKVALLKKGFPLDYLLSKTKIYHKEFYLNLDTLIPRIETIDFLQKITSDKKVHPKLKNSKTLIDLGSGSGLISVFLERYFSKIIASDYSYKSLFYTKKNFVLNSKKFKFFQTVHSNLFLKTSFRTLLKKLPAKILIANLPYVPTSNLLSRKKNKILFEPPTAIFAGHDGLFWFKKTLKQIQKFKLNFNLMFFELDPRNIKLAKKISFKLGYKNYIIKDLNKVDRFLCLSKKSFQPPTELS